MSDWPRVQQMRSLNERNNVIEQNISTHLELSQRLRQLQLKRASAISQMTSIDQLMRDYEVRYHHARGPRRAYRYQLRLKLSIITGARMMYHNYVNHINHDIIETRKQLLEGLLATSEVAGLDRSPGFQRQYDQLRQLSEMLRVQAQEIRLLRREIEGVRSRHMGTSGQATAAPVEAAVQPVASTSRAGLSPMPAVAAASPAAAPPPVAAPPVASNPLAARRSSLTSALRLQSPDAPVAQPAPRRADEPPAPPSFVVNLRQRNLDFRLSTRAQPAPAVQPQSGMLRSLLAGPLPNDAAAARTAAALAPAPSDSDDPMDSADDDRPHGRLTPDSFWIDSGDSDAYGDANALPSDDDADTLDDADAPMLEPPGRDDGAQRMRREHDYSAPALAAALYTPPVPRAHPPPDA